MSRKICGVFERTGADAGEPGTLLHARVKASVWRCRSASRVVIWVQERVRAHDRGAERRHAQGDERSAGLSISSSWFELVERDRPGRRRP